MFSLNLTQFAVIGTCQIFIVIKYLLPKIDSYGQGTPTCIYTAKCKVGYTISVHGRVYLFLKKLQVYFAK